MGRWLRGWVFVSVFLLAAAMFTAQAKPFAIDPSEHTAQSAGVNATRGPVNRGPVATQPTNERPRAEVTPPGCTQSGQANTIEEAFEEALAQWLKGATAAYQHTYTDLEIIDYELTYNVSGNRAHGYVDYEATVYDVSLEDRVASVGTVELWFSKNGCQWRLTRYDY